jgi:hypothetical protein
MSALEVRTTPDEVHASRASSFEDCLTVTHVDPDTASQVLFRKSVSDVEKSAFSVTGSSTASLHCESYYVRPMHSIASPDNSLVRPG